MTTTGNGTLETVDGRPALRFERRLPHSVDRVWRAVSDPAEMKQWFVATVDWTPAAGETIEAMGETVHVHEVDPPRRLAWGWGDERYSFDLAPDGDDGCVLTFLHVFDDRTLGAQHASGWDTYFARLDVHLGGGFLDEMEAHSGIAELHERYAEKFGLDPAPGRAMIAKIHSGEWEPASQ
jgi:uncharacterized protein YndB with AHSA1/START domain